MLGFGIFSQFHLFLLINQCQCALLLLSPDRLPSLHCGQGRQRLAGLPGRVGSQRGGLLRTPPAGGGEGSAHRLLQRRRRVRLPPPRDLPPSQSSGALQHQGRPQRLHPLQERLPADRCLFLPGKEPSRNENQKRVLLFLGGSRNVSGNESDF